MLGRKGILTGIQPVGFAEMETEGQKPAEVVVCEESSAIAKPPAAQTKSEKAGGGEEPDGDEEPGSAGKKTKSGELLSKLKEYKELISIMVFFLGGGFWINSTFATKTYVARMQCLLGATIQRVDNEAQSRIFQSDIIDHNVKLVRLQKDTTAANMIVEVETEKQQIADLVKKKSLADETAKKAAEAVGECDK
jgi:hypothetical protein